ncbi:DUF2161 domain-containing phosphodiesterase [Paenibacillus xerothermodurans]|uniref:Uncharacterized protein n=1 Tax=Paenibacillus xerothermodurans TaxID=1977292 RepID=A0A2W1N6W4_PAEXE|nr:DUF2161 family putative PD-(D/E)XK-type phosphodiesterase [Paenibacillus xerothermodurans]PZE20339.1 hypothetical protein CBW46_012905 [Paenibacillus xerothermodurans]
MAIKTETELYAPVKSYFEQLGYSVRGEVNHCDLVAMRGEEPPVIVELKKNFSIPLLLQGIERLKLTRRVYVAFELPNKGRAPHGASWPELRNLCQMLGIGMITVQFFQRKQPSVYIECHPAEAVGSAPVRAVRPRHNKRAAEQIVTEFKERHADYNVGGSTKLKLMTSYREKALHLAYLLQQHGPLSPRKLREMTGNLKTASLLQKNFYRWFQRVERGIYRVTPLGEEALLTYAHVVAELPLAVSAAREQPDQPQPVTVAPAQT